MSDTIRASIRVEGVVQGVGFRPFVYRVATGEDLAGSVKNLGDAGVAITVEGAEEDVELFLDRLRTDPPPLSVVESIEVDRGQPQGLESFEIRASSDASGGTGTIPPDTGICQSCLEDMRDPESRYHGYWATACVDCGPRFTVIRNLPYDRERTSMDEFPMCADCRAEYEDPSDRRYHAQAIACPRCGPTLSFRTSAGSERATRDAALEAARDALTAGDILAVKGIGGTHLVCDATDSRALDRLREGTGRPAKPFALMAPSLETIERFASVSTPEREALKDIRRPIVLLEIESHLDWLANVAPGLHTVGVMLPYAGLHHRLFGALETPLVMTSGNLPGRPMCTSEEEIFDRIEDVIDGALVHDREIVARCDDSVVRVCEGDRRFLRRSRGWVPQPLPRPVGAEGVDVLAMGPEFDVTIGVARGSEVILSQHIGDVDGPDTLAFHRAARTHLEDLTGADPDVVACDAHPAFETTAAAERLANGEPVRVQHHHAHAAGLLAEHGHSRGIVVTADGTGYGPEGSIWGGEILDASLRDYERVGGLDTFHLPGGERAIEYPGRILASLLEDEDRIEEILVSTGAVTDAAAARQVQDQLEAGINSPATTSAGRFLDAISALLGVCTHRRYEGEPAMCLEAVAADGTAMELDIPRRTRDGRAVVDTAAVTRALARRAETEQPADVAATTQTALADGLADIAIEAAENRGREIVGFSGGVAYNEAISERLADRVQAANLTYLGPDRVPPGDAGVAYGQAIVASASESR